MSITMNLYYTGKDGNAQVCGGDGTAGQPDRSARKPEMKIRLLFPMNDPETVLLIDSWKDQESLDIHHASLDGNHCRPQGKI